MLAPRHRTSYSHPREWALPCWTQDRHFALCLRFLLQIPVFIKERLWGVARPQMGVWGDNPASGAGGFKQDFPPGTAGRPAAGQGRGDSGSGAAGPACGSRGRRRGLRAAPPGLGAGAAQAARLHSASPPLDGIWQPLLFAALKKPFPG